MTEKIDEILNILQEECAEVIQVISKIRRFGLDDDYSGKTNREKLTQEVGDVLLLIDLLQAHGLCTPEELQELMKNLAISPNAINNSLNGGKAMDTFGLWIKDIEIEEPAEWMKGDPRGDIYRDIDNVEEYFEKYTTRPLKNFILQSKDFNIEEGEENIFDDDDLSLIDDGETEE